MEAVQPAVEAEAARPRQQLTVQGRSHRVGIHSAFQTLAIDEDRRRGADAQLVALGHRRLNDVPAAS